MQQPSEFERLVIVETKLDALIKSNEKLVAKFDQVMGNYVVKTEYDRDLENLRLEIDSAKRKTSLQTWITGSLAALFGIVMTLLVQNYFN